MPLQYLKQSNRQKSITPAWRTALPTYRYAISRKEQMACVSVLLPRPSWENIPPYSPYHMLITSIRLFRTTCYYESKRCQLRLLIDREKKYAWLSTTIAQSKMSYLDVDQHLFRVLRTLNIQVWLILEIESNCNKETKTTDTLQLFLERTD